MSRHEGVSCDSCLKGNFRGRRYKCLICYDYDLCATCYEAGATTTRHTTEHPVQCILTRSDFDLYYGGEALAAEQPQSLTCPFCGKMGLTEANLQEHVTSEHPDVSYQVVCPVCASLPGGDPNHVTDDFVAHLSLEHRTSSRDLISFGDEPATSRHGVRRIPHPGRGVGGPRARRSNMHFRESMDPITELLSQLSGVRRTANSSTPNAASSQLQQLQMQLQLERQQAQAVRQQVERLPRRQTQYSGVNNANNSGGGVTTTAATTTSSAGVNEGSSSSNNSQFLLSRLTEQPLPENEQQTQEAERADRGLFVQELILTTLVDALPELTDTVAGASGGDETTDPTTADTGGEESSDITGGEGGPVEAVQGSSHSPSPAPAAHTCPSPRASASPPTSAMSAAASSVAPRTVTSKNGGGNKGGSSRQGGHRAAHPPVRMTGTGTIQVPAMPPPPSQQQQHPLSGRLREPLRGAAPASGSSRRKPTRPLENRNLPSTDPPPPH